MNNRMTYALGVLLWGIPAAEPALDPQPPKEVTLLGTPEPVRLYRVDEYVICGYGGYKKPIGYYLTCAQAHETHPGKEVVAADYWRIGSTYLTGLQVEKIHVAPKPKRAKGAK